MQEWQLHILHIHTPKQYKRKKNSSSEGWLQQKDVLGGLTFPPVYRRRMSLASNLQHKLHLLRVEKLNIVLEKMFWFLLWFFGLVKVWDWDVATWIENEFLQGRSQILLRHQYDCMYKSCHLKINLGILFELLKHPKSWDISNYFRRIDDTLIP